MVNRKKTQKNLEKSANLSTITGIILITCSILWLIFCSGGTTGISEGVFIAVALLAILAIGVVMAAISYGKMKQYQTLYRQSRKLITEDEAAKIISRYMIGILLNLVPAFFLFLLFL